MEKRLEIEGSAAAKMVQLMRKHGHNRDITIEVAKVIAPMPELKIELSDGVPLERADLILTQTVAQSSLIAGDKVIVIGDDDTQFYYVIDKAVI